MSMFDSVLVKCRKCEQTLHFQSKAGECMNNFHLIDSVPVEIAVDLNGRSVKCNCGEINTITADIPKGNVKMNLS